MTTTEQSAKESAASAAADLIESDMIIGLGTGSTAEAFIKALARRNLKLSCVATSKRSALLAQALGLQLHATDQLSSIDITVDGADEIDSDKQMIKGGGGALLHEKITASMSRELMIIIDPTKRVNRLRNHPLPVEVIPYGADWTKKQIESLGILANLRQDQAGAPFKTDEKNVIFDLNISAYRDSYQTLHTSLISLPGVVETGFFLNIAGRVIIGNSDGTHEVWS